jgi:hypothetical protein
MGPFRELPAPRAHALPNLIEWLTTNTQLYDTLRKDNAVLFGISVLNGFYWRWK